MTEKLGNIEGCEIHIDDELETLLRIIKILGRDHVLRVRSKALMEQSAQSIEFKGQLLGGRFSVKLDFDFTPQGVA